MNRNILIAIAFIIIFAGGGIFLLSQTQKPTTTPQENSTVSQPTTAPTTDTDTSSAKTSRYQEFSKGILDQPSDNTVLFFFANWCPTCRPVDAEFNSNPDVIPDGVQVIRVNFNDSDTDQDEKELAKTYGVTYQHTFVQIDSDAKEVKKWIGGSAKDLKTNLQ